MQNQVELLAVDLDGTLLNEKNELSERNERALRAAIEKGVKVVIATGKTRYSALQLIAQLGLTTPGIYTQGLTVYNADGKITHEWTLDPNVARQVITFAQDRGFDIIAYSGQRVMVHRTLPAAEKLSERYGEPMPEAVGPLQNMVGEVPIHKLIAVRPGDPRRINALRWQLNMQLDGKGRLVQAMIKDMVEILPPAGSKGTALRVVLKDMSIAANKVMAIGDGENDIEMLQLAGVKVAVNNADERLKAVAEHIVATNIEDGVAEAIEKFILGEPLKDEAAAPEESTNAADTPASGDGATLIADTAPDNSDSPTIEQPESEEVKSKE